MRTDNLRCPLSLCGHAQVITDITEGMGKGMADFIEKEVLTVSDYDLYCHYVAGLVGIGLSQVRCPSLQAPQAAHCVAVYKVSICSPAAMHALLIMAAAKVCMPERLQEVTLHLKQACYMVVHHCETDGRHAQKTHAGCGCCCRSCSPRAGWRGGPLPRWRGARAWRTTWACSCRRLTSSATTWRTSPRSLPPGQYPPNRVLNCSALSF